MKKKYKKKYKKYLGIVFWTLIIVFILMLCFFLIPFSDKLRHTLFPGLFILAAIFFLLGIALIFLTIKLKIKGKLRFFLMLIGLSAPSFLIGVILHNFLYALNTIATTNFLKILTEALHVAFFLIALVACPIAFIIGVIGSIIARKRKY